MENALNKISFLTRDFCRQKVNVSKNKKIFLEAQNTICCLLITKISDIYVYQFMLKNEVYRMRTDREVRLVYQKPGINAYLMSRKKKSSHVCRCRTE